MLSCADSRTDCSRLHAVRAIDGHSWRTAIQRICSSARERALSLVANECLGGRGGSPTASHFQMEVGMDWYSPRLVSQLEGPSICHPVQQVTRGVGVLHTLVSA
ncbi:hypothetical protein M404DRAFT_818034 [Pisolithus tinctorius Marx 270]|uniref:Uncharacterized protein n=1 Tax=Pisolithus tinctorius Marx 270 TaxID=870435 RepID=A0A0C3NUT0_PISTI|nr:hypothetical protein M404DRAFT_818034 [Pisolithus tinctorius Marx 270]